MAFVDGEAEIASRADLDRVSSSGVGRLDALGLFVTSGAAALLCWVFGFASGVHVTAPDRLAKRVLPAKPGPLEESWAAIESELGPQAPEHSEIESRAIEGMLAGLEDPFADYADRAKAARIADGHEDGSREALESHWARDDALLLRIPSFDPGQLRRFRRLLADAGGSRALILDLRGNAGGHLRALPEMLGLFYEGRAYSEESRAGLRHVQTAPPFGGPEVPEALALAVLVDAETASAAEILALALREQRSALIVGRRSQGKDSIQGIAQLSDGSALRFTVGRWYSAAGRSLEAGGLVPDILVEPFAAPHEGGLDPDVAAALAALARTDKA